MRDVLAELFPEAADAQRMIDDADLRSDRIVMEGKPINRWHSIVTEARKRDKAIRLLEVALGDYSDQRLTNLLQQAQDEAQQVFAQSGPRMANDARVENVLSSDSSFERSQVSPDWAASTGDKIVYFREAIASLDICLDKFRDASEAHGHCVALKREVRRLESLLGPETGSDTALIEVYERYWNANFGDIEETFMEATKTPVKEWLTDVRPPLARVKREAVANYEARVLSAADHVAALTEASNEDATRAVRNLRSSALTMEMLWWSIVSGLYTRINETFVEMSEHLDS